MSVGKLKKISVTEKEYVLKDLNLNSTSETVKNIKTEEVEFYGVEPSQVVKIILTNYYNYMYASDKFVYRTWDNNFDFFNEFPLYFRNPVKILIVPVFRMSEGIFVYDKSSGKITDFSDMYAENVYGGVDAILVGGKVLILREGVIYISNDFNYMDGHVAYNFDMFVSFPSSELGSAVAFYEVGDRVYAIYQKGIFNIYVAKNIRDCLCDKMIMPKLDVYSESVLVINGIAYMISDKQLVKFDGKTIKHVDGLLDSLSVLEFGGFSTDGTRYFANVKLADGSQYVYVYDVMTGEEILGDYYKLVCKEKPYVYDANLDAIRLITVQTENVIKAEGCLETVDDLGTCAEKIITGYEIHLSGSAELVVGGEFGEKTFALKSGCNSSRCNLNSKEFSFRFVNPSNDFKIIKAKIKYRTCGE